MSRRFSSARIRALREANGLTVRQFARKIGSSPQLVNSWESGDWYPTMPKLHVLMDAFGVQEGYFFVDSPTQRSVG